MLHIAFSQRLFLQQSGYSTPPRSIRNGTTPANICSCCMGVHISKGFVWMLRLSERLQAAVTSPTNSSTHKDPSGHEKHGVPFFSVVLRNFIYNEKGVVNHYFPVRRHISIIKRLFRGGVAGGLCRCGVGVVLIWNKYSESILSLIHI